MMTTKLDVHHVLRELSEIVAEVGADYVYTDLEGVVGGSRCAYFHGDVPGCIVGHVLARHGIGLDDMPDENTDTGVLALSENYSADDFLPWDPQDATLLAVLEAAQGAQDRGNTWEDALEDAYRAARRRGIEVSA